MLSTESVGNAVAACGMGVISGGIWMAFGAGAGLIAFGIAMVLIGAAAAVDANNGQD